MDPRIQLYFLVRENGSSDTIRELLSELLHVNITDRIPTFLLQVAADSTLNNLMVVRELINAGADVNWVNVNGLTPLHCAVLRRKRSVVIALIESGANVNAESTEKRTPLHFAISNYEHYNLTHTSYTQGSGLDIRIVETLLEQENIRINKRDDNGETPLIWAVRHKQLNTVLLLLEKGANPYISNRESETPLHIALYDEKPSLAILVELLTHRVGLNCADRKRKTPVDILIQNIGKKQTLQEACECLKVVALHYSNKKPLKRKLESNIQLGSYLKNCCKIVRRMRSDIIAEKKTVHDFVMTRFNQSDFENPVIQVYKPIVERLLAGLYLKYLDVVLHSVSKTNLLAVFEIVLFKYCEKTKNGEEIIHSIDRKELFDIKNRHEISDTVGCESMTDVKECNEFLYSKNCKHTSYAKDRMDTSDARDSMDMSVARGSMDTPDDRDSMDVPNPKDSMVAPDAKDSMVEPDAKNSMYSPDSRDSMHMTYAKDMKDTPDAKDSKDATEAKNCPKINFKFFLIINLLSEYLSILDVFHLIATFSPAKISELSKMNYN